LFIQESDTDPPMMFRGRVHTLAVMNAIKKPTGVPANSSSLIMNNRANQSKEPVRSGINPRYIF
jgi:hypothetical protein